MGPVQFSKHAKHDPYIIQDSYNMGYHIHTCIILIGPLHHPEEGVDSNLALKTWANSEVYQGDVGGDANLHIIPHTCQTRLMHPSGLKHIRIVYHNLQHDRYGYGGYGWPVEDAQDIDIIITPKTSLTINASAGKLCKKVKMNSDTSKKNMADDVVRYVAWKGQRALARVRVL